MKKIGDKNLAYLMLIIGFFFIIPLSAYYNTDKNSINIQLFSTPVNINITSNIPAVGENTFLNGTIISFEFPDQTWTSVQLQLTGKTKGETYSVTIKKTTLWSGSWDTNHPSGSSIPASPDTYSITITADSVIQTTVPSEIILVADQGFPLWLIFVIIGAAAAGVIVSSLFVVKKKKAARKADVEFGKVDSSKTKKKGQVFKGASAIGKQSGKMAEAKTGKVESKAESETDSGARVFKFKESDQPSSTVKSQQIMPASPGFEFETRASAGAAIMKSMEMQLDLDSKVNFTISKIDSLLQNIEFFKAILLQQEQQEPRCPNCDKKMSNYWSVCPYCEIKDHDSELGLKQSMISISADIKFCPNCKRIIKPNWISCPFCYVNN